MEHDVHENDRDHILALLPRLLLAARSVVEAALEREADGFGPATVLRVLIARRHRAFSWVIESLLAASAVETRELLDRAVRIEARVSTVDDRSSRAVLALRIAIASARRREGPEAGARLPDLLAGLVTCGSPAVERWCEAVELHRGRLGERVGVRSLAEVGRLVVASERSLGPSVRGHVGDGPEEPSTDRLGADDPMVAPSGTRSVPASRRRGRDRRLRENRDEPSSGDATTPTELGRLVTRVERALRSRLDAVAIGQEAAKQALVAAAIRHLLRRVRREVGREVVLLVGPTGNGKTLLVETLARALRAPLVRENAPDFSRAGYVGRSVGDIARDLAEAAQGDAELGRRAILLIDEVDKLALPSDRGRAEVGWRAVQEGLLTLLEGGVVTASEMPGAPAACVDVSANLIILAGAFEGLAEVAAERRSDAGGVRGFGAGRLGENVRAGRSDALDLDPTTEDLVAYGLIPELVGRVTTLAVLRPLEPDDLVEVLRRSERSALREERELFASHGVELELTEGALREAAIEAHERCTGARALAAVLRDRLRTLRAELPRLATAGVRRVAVDAAAWRGEAPPTLERAGAGDARDERGLVAAWRKIASDIAAE